eukprot:gnl/Chilomastix_cuspidata/1542.p1 GENE.gnl/Chilomastix_cuspidata/1542~~gnl/Chilomastix_cuspidata/1542.p1  ORF type:complete len:599 (+),score=295.08 gnl/Chilomastix_cuspidata/1542:929-2725(+)
MANACLTNWFQRGYDPSGKPRFMFLDILRGIGMFMICGMHILHYNADLEDLFNNVFSSGVIGYLILMLVLPVAFFGLMKGVFALISGWIGAFLAAPKMRRLVLDGTRAQVFAAAAVSLGVALAKFAVLILFRWFKGWFTDNYLPALVTGGAAAVRATPAVDFMVIRSGVCTFFAYFFLVSWFVFSVLFPLAVLVERKATGGFQTARSRYVLHVAFAALCLGIGIACNFLTGPVEALVRRSYGAPDGVDLEDWVNNNPDKTPLWLIGKQFSIALVGNRFAVFPFLFQGFVGYAGGMLLAAPHDFVEFGKTRDRRAPLFYDARSVTFLFFVPFAIACAVVGVAGIAIRGFDLATIGAVNPYWAENIFYGGIELILALLLLRTLEYMPFHERRSHACCCCCGARTDKERLVRTIEASTWLRRYSTASLTIFVLELLFMYPVTFLFSLFIPEILEKNAVPFDSIGLLLLAVPCHMLVCDLILRAWDRVGFIGSPDWILSFLGLLLTPGRRGPLVRRLTPNHKANSAYLLVPRWLHRKKAGVTEPAGVPSANGTQETRILTKDSSSGSALSIRVDVSQQHSADVSQDASLGGDLSASGARPEQ